MQIAIEDLHFFKDEKGQDLNPRKHLNPGQLAGTVKAVGVQDPIRITKQDDKWYVLDGHRRIATAKSLGHKTIEALEVPMPQDPLLYMAVASIREPLRPLEMAQTLQSLMPQYDIVELGEMVSLTPDMIELHLVLLDADETVQRRVNSGQMSWTAFRSLRAKPKVQQAEIMEHFKEDDTVTVRQVRAAVKRLDNEQTGMGMLEQLGSEHALLDMLRRTRTALYRDYEDLTLSEKRSVSALVASMMQVTEKAHA